MASIAALVLASSPAAAKRVARYKRVAGVPLPRQVRVADRTLVLNGAGVHEATMFDIDVYVGGLYLEKRTHSASAILRSDQAKHLQLRFKRDVSRAKLLNKIRRGLRKRGRSVRQLMPLLRGIDNIREGDVLTFTELPDHTLELRHNGVLKARAVGRQVAHALFSSFLGPRPVNKALRRRLLGR